MTEQPLGESVTPPKPAAEGSSDGAPAPEAAPANAAAPSSGVAPTQGAAPAEGPDAAPAAAPAAPPARPRPEYGEYAPEGWEWKPEGDAPAESAAVAGTSGAAGVPNAPGASTAGSIQGVPHNLGAGSSRPTRKAASQQSSGAPYRAAPGQQVPPAANTGAAAGFAGSAVKPPSMADRVVTILLLMVGAYGALQFALAMMGLESMFALMAEAPGVDELTTPGWLGMTGKIVGMAILVFYGLVLVFSIRRMRAKKLTFWVPLTAGVIAFIAVTVVIASAMFATPELLTIIGDPERSTQLLEYLQSFPTS